MSTTARGRSAAARSRWTNWAGNQVCAPARVVRPVTVGEIVDAVHRAAEDGLPVKAVGSGHSFTDAACTHGVQLDLGEFDHVRRIDRERGLVTVEAGVTIERLNHTLAAVGLAMPNLGDVGYQTVSGAIATGTHGTGRDLGGLATFVERLELVTGTGDVVTCDRSTEPDVFAAARVGLGALGVVTQVTLQCVPAFNLRAVEEPMRLDAVLDELDGHIAANDHFEFYWVPHTRWALTKRNNRTDEPAGGRSRWQEWYQDVALQNVAFGAMCRVGRRRPELIPRVAKLIPSTGRVEYVDRSDKVFTSPRHVRFTEMEYGVPREHLVDMLRGVVDLVEREAIALSFPVEVRVSKADDIALSPAQGRDSGWVAVHVYKGTPYEGYFRGVEAVADELDGRPHWGKLHFQTAATLAPRYDAWGDFQGVRRRLDPEGRFANAYTDRVLGSVT